MKIFGFSDAGNDAFGTEPRRAALHRLEWVTDDKAAIELPSIHGVCKALVQPRAGDTTSTTHHHFGALLSSLAELHPT